MASYSSRIGRQNTADQGERGCPDESLSRNHCSCLCLLYIMICVCIYIYLSSSRSHHRSGCVYAAIRSMFRVRPHHVRPCPSPRYQSNLRPPPPFIHVRGDRYRCRNDFRVLLFASRYAWVIHCQISRNMCLIQSSFVCSVIILTTFLSNCLSAAVTWLRRSGVHEAQLIRGPAPRLEASSLTPPSALSLVVKVCTSKRSRSCRGGL